MHTLTDPITTLDNSKAVQYNATQNHHYLYYILPIIQTKSSLII